MSRFTNLFQPKPAAPVVEESIKDEVVSKSTNKVVEITNWKSRKNNK